MASLVAAGNIGSSRFVKLGTAEGTVLQCGSAERPYGIAHEGGRRAPHPDITDSGYAAISGENLRVYEEEETCLLEAGATIAYGDLLGSDTNGKGTPVTADEAFYGAIALEAGVSGQLLKVKVRMGQIATA